MVDRVKLGFLLRWVYRKWLRRFGRYKVNIKLAIKRDVRTVVDAWRMKILTLSESSIPHTDK